MEVRRATILILLTPVIIGIGVWKAMTRNEENKEPIEKSVSVQIKEKFSELAKRSGSNEEEVFREVNDFIFYYMHEVDKFAGLIKSTSPQEARNFNTKNLESYFSQDCKISHWAPLDQVGPNKTYNVAEFFNGMAGLHIALSYHEKKIDIGKTYYDENYVYVNITILEIVENEKDLYAGSNKTFKIKIDSSLNMQIDEVTSQDTIFRDELTKIVRAEQELLKDHQLDSNLFALEILPRDTVLHLQGSKTVRTPILVKDQKIPFKLDLSNRTFLNKVFFDSVIFEKPVKITQSTFENGLQFKNVRFGQLLDLSGSELAHELKFTTLKRPPDSLNLQEFKVVNFDNDDKVDLYHSFQDKEDNVTLLNISKTDIKSLSIRYGPIRLWKPKRMTPEQVGGLYFALKSKFRQEGYHESLKELDIEYKRHLYENGSISELVVGKLLDFWWAFGYQKHKVIYNTLLFFIFFVTINSIFLRKLITTVYMQGAIAINDEKYDFEEELNKAYQDGSLKGFLKRLQIAFFYTATIFFGFKLELHRINYHNFGGMLYIFLTKSVGLACLAFIVNFILAK